MRSFNLVLFVLAVLQDCSKGDIPGIPSWAQDLARCAPGSPQNLVVRGLFNRPHPQDILNPPQAESDPPRLFSRPLFSRRPKRMGFVDDVNGGIKKWPFIGRFEFAELQNWFPRKHMISNVATLIAPDLVLTARHVIDNIEPAYQKKVTKIYFGSNNRWTMSFSDISRSISEIYFFPDPLVDLAVLKLNTPVNCNTLTKSYALVSMGKDSLDDVYQCRAASWGKDQTGQCPATLKSGSFKLFNQKHEYEICARGFNKTLTNVGDSGMPLMCKEPKTGIWLQYGVFSYDYWVGDFKVSCFISVPYCYTWINKIIDEASDFDQSDIDAYRTKCPSPVSFEK